MPIRPTYPGVYVEEIPSGVRTITGVSTSDTAFVDFFSRGPTTRAVRLTSLSEFDKVFGGLDRRSEASYAIQQFFLNGGSVAWVVRAVSGATAATRLLPADQQGEGLRVSAASEGKWGRRIEVAFDYKTNAEGLFNLVVREVETGARRRILATEVFRNLSPSKVHFRFAQSVVNSESALVRVEVLGANRPTQGQDAAEDVVSLAGDPSDEAAAAFAALEGGGDGTEPGTNGWTTDAGAAALVAALPRLREIAPFVFNILCVPAATELDENGRKAVLANAVKLCEDLRAFVLVDVPTGAQTEEAVVAYAAGLPKTNHAALYYPRLRIPDPLNQFRPRECGASGSVAGVYARTDATRGVWKAPAGTDADLRGVDLTAALTDGQNGALNPLGINVLRNFPVFGNVVWGARTLQGSDQEASEWKYVPVRRVASYIEESLSQGLKWVVFEPNDEPLWAQIRLNVGAFMHNLFRQGAFQGRTPREAYLVKCDRETTTQNDINLGIVNIVVGFAPLKPAEFVILRIQQMAGQIQS